MNILLKLMHIKRTLLTFLKQTTLTFYYIGLRNTWVWKLWHWVRKFRDCVLKMTSQNIVSKLNSFQRFAWNHTEIDSFLAITICSDIHLRHSSRNIIIKDLAVREYLKQYFFFMTNLLVEKHGGQAAVLCKLG